MGDYENLTDRDFKWVKENFKEGPQDEGWWGINQFEQMINSDTWGPEFEEEEKEESDYLNTYGEYHLYTFADSDYHLVLFWAMKGLEYFVSLDDDSKPFKTLGRLALTFNRFLQQYSDPYGGPIIINKVPKDYGIRKYRSLYGFEKRFLDDYLYGGVERETLLKSAQQLNQQHKQSQVKSN